GGGRHGDAVEGDAIAALEVDGDVFRLVGRILRVVGARVDVVGGLFPGVFQYLAFGRGVQQVCIGAERTFAALVLGDGDLVLLCPRDQCGTAGQVPFAPGGDDLDVGVECIG